MAKRDIAIIVHDTAGQPVKKQTLAVYSRVDVLTTDDRGIVTTHNVAPDVQDICVKLASDEYVQPYIVSPLIPADRSFNLGIGIPVGPSDVSVMPGPVHIGAFPPKPTRAQVCGVNMTFQGQVIVVDGVQYPWFETALQCFPLPSQRQSILRQKKAHGDTHAMIEFFPANTHIYEAYDTPYGNMISPDFEGNPQLYLQYVEEILIEGLIPGCVYNGDNGDNPTDGYPNALRQMPVLYNLLKSSVYGDLNEYCLMLRFWDSVYYGSAFENIVNFGRQFRALDSNPNRYLGIEHNPGHIPGFAEDFEPGGRMDGYDVIFSEFEDSVFPGNPPGPDYGNDSYWQIIGRLNRPYNRPADQPDWDDPNPPMYLQNSSRGERFYCAFEFTDYGEYPWVRVDMNNYHPLQDLISRRRAYVRAMGCKYTG